MYADASGVWNTLSRNDPLVRWELSPKTRPVMQGNLGVVHQSARLRDPDFLPRNGDRKKTENAEIDGVLLITGWEEPQIFQIFAQSFANIPIPGRVPGRATPRQGLCSISLLIFFLVFPEPLLHLRR